MSNFQDNEKYAIDNIKKFLNRLTSIMKDHSDAQQRLSKELRDWLSQIAGIGATIIGVIVAFQRDKIQDSVLIISLVLLGISIIVSLFHRQNVVQAMSIDLFKSYKVLEDWIEEQIKLWENYRNLQSDDCLLKIKEHSENIPKYETKTLHKDKYIFIVIFLFSVSIFLLIFHVIKESGLLF